MTSLAVEYEQLLARAAPYLHLRHPGHANQKVHGRPGRKKRGNGPDATTPAQFDARVAKAADGIDANDATHFTTHDREVENALAEYKGGEAFIVNDSLRQSKGDLSDARGRVKDTAVPLDRGFAEHHPLDRDIVVTRGIQDIEATFGGRDPKPGLTWVDHGYVSTSSRMQGQRDIFHGEAGAQMRILVPKGTRAMSHDSLELDEIVIDRGHTFRVVRDRGVDFDGIRQLDVEVVPK